MSYPWVIYKELVNLTVKGHSLPLYTDFHLPLDIPTIVTPSPIPTRRRHYLDPRVPSPPLSSFCRFSFSHSVIGF